MIFGHLKDNKFIHATMPITINDRDYFTDDPELMLQAGEKELVITERPTEAKQSGKYVLSYKETDTQIIQVWNFIKYTEEELHTRYQNLSIKYIHEKYSANDENKVIREYLAYGEEYKPAFDEYNTYVEDCKARAHAEIYGESV